MKLRWMLGSFAVLALACGDDGDGSVYDTADEAASLTLDSGGSDDSNDFDASSDDGSSTGMAKLDSLPEEMADDGEDPECDEDIDIVFVMDVSTTMGPFFDALEQEIANVHQALQAYDLPNDVHYGLVVFVDDFTLVGAGAPYTDIDQLAADFATWNQFTATNEQTQGGGFNSTWTENSLDALFAAAGGFQWRAKDTTLRMIVHTTDDTFWNGPTVGNGVDILHGYPEVVDILQQSEIRMFTFADLIGGQCECDDVSMGFFTPFQGAEPIPAQTGGGAYNIGEVLAGIISIADAITEAVEESYCEPYPPIG